MGHFLQWKEWIYAGSFIHGDCEDMSLCNQNAIYHPSSSSSRTENSNNLTWLLEKIIFPWACYSCFKNIIKYSINKGLMSIILKKSKISIGQIKWAKTGNSQFHKKKKPNGLKFGKICSISSVIREKFKKKWKTGTNNYNNIKTDFIFIPSLKPKMLPYSSDNPIDYNPPVSCVF